MRLSEIRPRKVVHFTQEAREQRSENEGLGEFRFFIFYFLVVVEVSQSLHERFLQMRPQSAFVTTKTDRSLGGSGQQRQHILRRCVTSHNDVRLDDDRHYVHVVVVTKSLDNSVADAKTLLADDVFVGRLGVGVGENVQRDGTGRS